MEAANVMLKQEGMPKFYWAEAVKTTMYLQNRITTKWREGVTTRTILWVEVEFGTLDGV